MGHMSLFIINLPNKEEKLKELFYDMHPHDIFILVEGLEPDQIAQIITALGIPKGIELFEEFRISDKKRIFAHFTKECMADVLQEMSPDERVAFIKDLPKDMIENVHPLVAQAKRNDIKKLLQYKEGTAGSILTNVKNVKKTIKDAAEAAMRQTIGDRGVDEALTIGKEEIQDAAEKRLQRILDHYESGIHVVTVKLQDVHPPGEVKEAFEGVASAKEAKERLVNEALGKYNTEVPRARGEAEKTIKEAEAYAVQRVKHSQGEAKRFLQRLKAYREAKIITKDRLYLETMREILPDIEKVIMAEPREGILKFLN